MRNQPGVRPEDDKRITDSRITGKRHPTLIHMTDCPEYHLESIICNHPIGLFIKCYRGSIRFDTSNCPVWGDRGIEVMVQYRRLLYIGTHGTDVAMLQDALASLGYYYGPVDGIFGPLTQQAVINFQRTQGLTPDGIVGPMTYGVLEQLIP